MRPHCFRNTHPETQRSSRRLVTVYTILIMLQIKSHSVKVRQQAPVNYAISWALWTVEEMQICGDAARGCQDVAKHISYIHLHTLYDIKISSHRRPLSHKSKVFLTKTLSLKVQPSPTEMCLCSIVLRLRHISDLFIKLKVIKWV